MAFALLASDEAFTVDSNTAVTGSLNLTGADMITVAVAAGTGCTVSDNGSRTYTKRNTPVSATPTINLFDCIVPGGDLSAVVITASDTGNFPYMIWATWSVGSGPAVFVNVSAGNTAAAATSVATGSSAADGSGNLCWAGIAADTGLETGYTPDSSFTLVETELEAASWGGAAAYKLSGSSENVTWSLDGVAPVITAHMARYKETAGGGSAVTYYLNNPVVGGGSAGTLAVSAPTASTSTTGWTVGTTVATRYSRQTYNTEVASTNFTVTAQPSGSPVNSAEDCWRLSGVTSGSYSAGTWYSSLSVIAVTSGGFQDGRARFRIWRSANADGTSATELTQGTMVGTTVTNLSTTVAQSSSASTQIAGFSLTNEFLLLQVAWETL